MTIDRSWPAGPLTPIQNVVPYLFGAFRIPEEIAILGVDHPLLHQELDVEGATPELLADENDGQRLDFARLRQR